MSTHFQPSLDNRKEYCPLALQEKEEMARRDKTTRSLKKTLEQESGLDVVVIEQQEGMEPLSTNPLDTNPAVVSPSHSTCSLGSKDNAKQTRSRSSSKETLVLPEQTNPNTTSRGRGRKSQTSTPVKDDSVSDSCAVVTPSSTPITTPSSTPRRGRPPGSSKKVVPVCSVESIEIPSSMAGTLAPTRVSARNLSRAANKAVSPSPSRDSSATSPQKSTGKGVGRGRWPRDKSKQMNREAKQEETDQRQEQETAEQEVESEHDEKELYDKSEPDEQETEEEEEDPFQEEEGLLPPQQQGCKEVKQEEDSEAVTSQDEVAEKIKAAEAALRSLSNEFEGSDDFEEEDVKGQDEGGEPLFQDLFAKDKEVGSASDDSHVSNEDPESLDENVVKCQSQTPQAICGRRSSSTSTSTWKDVVCLSSSIDRSPPSL